MDDKRCAECPDEDASLLRAMEFHFAMPVFLTQDQQRRLHQLLSEIVDAPWNQLVDGVHWLAEWGAKPQWREPEEPTFDDTVLTGSSCARGFVSDKERDRVLKRRQDNSTEAESDLEDWRIGLSAKPKFRQHEMYYEPPARIVAVHESGFGGVLCKDGVLVLEGRFGVRFLAPAEEWVTA